MLVQISLTACFTLLGGTLLFVLNKWHQRRYSDLFAEIDEIRGDVMVTIVFNAQVYGNPRTWSSTRMIDAQNELRMMSARIRAAMFKARRTWLFDLFYGVKKEELSEAGSRLIGLSNTISGTDFKLINEEIDIIKSLLKL